MNQTWLVTGFFFALPAVLFELYSEEYDTNKRPAEVRLFMYCVSAMRSLKVNFGRNHG